MSAIASVYSKGINDSQQRLAVKRKMSHKEETGIICMTIYMIICAKRCDVLTIQSGSARRRHL